MNHPDPSFGTCWSRLNQRVIGGPRTLLIWRKKSGRPDASAFAYMSELRPRHPSWKHDETKEHDRECALNFVLT